MDDYAELAGRIERAVEELEGELFAFLRRIVRIPTAAARLLGVA